MPTRACVAGIFIFLVGRAFFWAIPNGFIAYPETQIEYNFYKQDLRCKAHRPVAQVVIQGTSRLEMVQKLPVFEKRWHTPDRMVNISQPLNTFWHMNLLHRRNPGLLDSTEFWIIDVLPVQMRVSLGFNERDALFLRESTLAERLRVRSAADRARAVADWVLPFWSQHHSAANWGRALFTLRDAPAQQLETLMAIDGNRLPDITGARSGFPQDDPDFSKRVFAKYLYTPGEPESLVQRVAFRELLARRPSRTQLYLVHPPYRDDFSNYLSAEAIDSAESTREVVLQEAGDHVHVEWFQDPRALGFADEDFAPDGVHASMDGILEYEKLFAQRYRKWVPIDSDHPEPEGRP